MMEETYIPKKVHYTRALGGLVPRRWQFTTNDTVNPDTGVREGKFVKVSLKAQFRHWWDINNPLRRRMVTLNLEKEDYFYLCRAHEPIEHTDEDEDDGKYQEIPNKTQFPMDEDREEEDMYLASAGTSKPQVVAKAE